MKRLWESAVRLAMRRGFDRGLLEGDRAWLVIGGLALLGHLAARAVRREPETVFSDLLAPGEAITISHETR
jgi:hypothetical protein